MTPSSFFNAILYQAGALSGFLKLDGLEMSHVKCHGQAVESFHNRQRVS